MGHSDVGRADARCRAMMEPHIENFIATAARVLGSKNVDEAILAVSAMVGALAISRSRESSPIPGARRCHPTRGTRCRHRDEHGVLRSRICALRVIDLPLTAKARHLRGAAHY
jgi:hypothetical protein